MKVKYFALAAVLALVFTGCSANREETSSDPVPPTNSVGADRDGYVSPDIDSNAYNSDGLIGDGPSAGVGGGIDNSPGIDNDAAEGGGRCGRQRLRPKPVPGRERGGRHRRRCG